MSKRILADLLGIFNNKDIKSESDNIFISQLRSALLELNSIIAMREPYLQTISERDKEIQELKNQIKILNTPKTCSGCTHSFNQTRWCAGCSRFLHACADRHEKFSS